MSNNRLDARSHEGDSLWAVSCDFCGKQAPATCDPGDSAERARRAGFTTKSRGASEPMEWKCPSCRKAPQLPV